MNAVYDVFNNVFVDRDSGCRASNLTALRSKVKARRLALPPNRFLSNRFILNNISEQGSFNPTFNSVTHSFPARDYSIVRGD